MSSPHPGTPPLASISSSFPLSSPTFWTAAVTVPTPSPPLPLPTRYKRAREDDDDDDHRDEQALREIDSDIDIDPEIKRVRFCPPPSSSSPNGGTDSQGQTQTALSYLPNRLGEFDASDPHAYLANPEYAPNSFGDIGDYMRKKEIKVQTQNRDIALAAAQSGLPQIFAGISFYINGNTHPPMEELRKMILQRGGEVRPVLRNKGMVKFIIAPMLTQSKFKQFERYRVVREGWIMESCAQGKLLDWTRWKLQVQGGWEQSGRKGMEGFLKSQQVPSQAVSSSAKKEASPVPTPPSPIPTTASVTFPAKSEDPEPVLPSIPPIVTSTSRGLLTPLPSKPIPISPGKREEASPASVPANVQRPEGAWEFYHSKESNENAAEAMKNLEWRARNTAERGNEGGFIDGYYQNSRLHHLSTWKAELKVLVADAQKRSEEISLSQPSASSIAPFSLANSTLPSRASATGTSALGAGAGEKVIFHVDFDCFFVSCGLATRPHLKGKPTVVCHSQAGKGASSTSEIASCSYEARAKGVKNGMSLGRARTLVGDELQTIPYEFETYKRFSLAFYTILMGYADDLQAVSVDEALIDVTSAVAARAMAPEEAEERPVNDAEDEPDDGRRRGRDPAVEIAEKIRDDVRAVTEGCEGISHNILLAKLATRAAKPAGVYHLLSPAIPPFLSTLDVEDFPSIGYSIRSKIEEKFGTTKVEGLLGISKLAFQRVLGPKTGEMLWGYLRGVDERKIEGDKQRKSVSAEMNYGIRFQNTDQAEICIADLAAEVAKRMNNLGVKGRQLTLKLMKRHPDAPIEPPKFMGHGWCETFNRSSPISTRGGGPTDNPEVLANESVKLLRAMKLDPVELRGVGIQVTKLDSEKDKKEEREVGQGVLSFQPKKAVVSDKPKPHTRSTLESSVVKDSSSGGTPSPTNPSVDGETLKESDQLLEAKSETAAEVAPPITILDDEPSVVIGIPGPSSEGIDPEFLAALPPDLQLEVRRDYAQNRRSRATSERLNTSTSAGPRSAGTGTTSTTGSKRATTESPNKTTATTGSERHEAAHITRQLRPKNKTQMAVGKIAQGALYGAWSRAQNHNQTHNQNQHRHREQADEEELDGIVDLTTGPGSSDDEGDEDLGKRTRIKKIGEYEISEIIDLGIDLEVFEALPEDMRTEVMQQERDRAKRRPSRPRVLGPLRKSAIGGAGVRDRTTSRERSPPPDRQSRSRSRAGSLPLPLPLQGITIVRPPKPALLTATTPEEVLNTLSRWIDSRRSAPPAERDAAKVQSFLVGCVERGGLGGVELAVQGLGWMRVVLREKWGEDLAEEEEKGADGRAEGDTDGVGVFGGGAIHMNIKGGKTAQPEPEPEPGMGPGEQWWFTWREMRDHVSRAALLKFGAVLKI